MKIGDAVGLIADDAIILPEDAVTSIIDPELETATDVKLYAAGAEVSDQVRPYVDEKKIDPARLVLDLACTATNVLLFVVEPTEPQYPVGAVI